MKNERRVYTRTGSASVECRYSFFHEVNHHRFRMLERIFQALAPFKPWTRFNQLPEWLHNGAQRICPCNLVHQTEPRSSICDGWWSWKIHDCSQHGLWWSHTICSEAQASKVHIFLAKLELAFVKHDAILCSQSKIIESMIESILNAFIIQKSIIHNLDNPRHVLNDVIVPPGVGISRCKEPLRHPAIQESSPFSYKGCQQLWLLIKWDRMVPVDGIQHSLHALWGHLKSQMQRGVSVMGFPLTLRVKVLIIHRSTRPVILL